MAFLRTYGWLRQATNRLWRDRIACLGVLVIGGTALAALFVPQLSPMEPVINHL